MKERKPKMIKNKKYIPNPVYVRDGYGNYILQSDQWKYGMGKSGGYNKGKFNNNNKFKRNNFGNKKPFFKNNNKSSNNNKS